MCNPRLTAAEHAVLADLLAADPGATMGRIAIRFRARTGRGVSKSTIRDHRRGLVRPGSEPRKGAHLPPNVERALDRLIRESWPDATMAEVRAEFLATTGRPVAASTVGRRRRALGFPPLPPGPRPGSGAGPGELAARVEAASAAKRERSKVDRSPRVGRAGRALIDEGR